MRMAGGKRVFVLGIDGVPHSLVVRLANEGIMPHLGRLMTASNSCQMDSVMPTVSNVAWACFLTGKNPGKFDIFGFAEVDGDMQLRLPNGRNLRSRTLPEIVSDAGGKVICLGVPSSYPPRPINGLLCGCFLSPSIKEAVYPPQRLAELEALGYQLDIDPVRARQDQAYLRQSLVQVLEGRRRTVEHMLKSDAWDLFVLHVMETDRLNHFLWRQWQQGQADEKAFFEDFYRKVDDFIGYLAEQLGPDTLIVMSDHGFCSIKAEVQLNRWLISQGYLSIDGQPSQMLAAISPASKAFALVPGRVHLLSSDSYSRGCVAQGQYEEVRRELMARLGELVDPETGERVCKEIRTREEVYAGPYIRHAPDIVIDPVDGYDFKAALAGEGIFDSSPLTGMHTRNDAFFLATGKRLVNQRLSVIDTTRTVLDLLGIAAPPDLDSRGMLE